MHDNGARCAAAHALTLRGPPCTAEHAPSRPTTPPPPVLPRPISMEEHTHHDLQKKPLSPNPQEECVKTRNSHDVG
ncbi:hypothetical protein AGIG_G4936 [Arapaima gigas]